MKDVETFGIYDFSNGDEGIDLCEDASDMYHRNNGNHDVNTQKNVINITWS
jgi:hypothetical protein